MASGRFYSCCYCGVKDEPFVRVPSLPSHRWAGNDPMRACEDVEACSERMALLGLEPRAQFVGLGEALLVRAIAATRRSTARAG